MHFRKSKGKNGAASGRIAEALVAGLRRGGVRTVVFSPGSRSTPLVLALAGKEEFECKVVLDERSAAFYALGIAACTKLPIALVCTSGSAPAHYLPALIEARYQKLPLVVVSADRPAELRDCGAGQTIDQVSLFPRDVVWTFDLSVQANDAGLQRAYTAALRACRESAQGPVHLNLPFHEPFLPHPQTPYEPLGVEVEAILPLSTTGWDASGLARYRRGLILAGAVPSPCSARWAEGLYQLSDFLGWPVLCDVLNPGRWGEGGLQRVVSQYEIFFREKGKWLEDNEVVPEAILQIGSLPTAKSLRQWLETYNGAYWQLQPDARDRDPTHRGGAWLTGSPDTAIFPSTNVRTNDFRKKWMEAESESVALCKKYINESEPTFEGALYPRLLERLPANARLFIANSTPVRDAERYAVSGHSGLEVFSNRGVNGIDGLVSTAFGLANDEQPTVAILGDLAFLHDVGGLRLGNQFKGNLTLIVIDNGGGRIFESLPIRERPDVLNAFFLTPQAVDISKICEAHGLECNVLERGFDSLPKDFEWENPGVRVWLYPTHPDRDRCRREEISSSLTHHLFSLTPNAKPEQ